MTEIGATTRRSHEPEGKGGNVISRFFGSIGLFIGQVIDEMRKVVYPTRSQLWQYTAVVIVFVVFMMALVAALDFVFTKGVFWVFGG
ncbi:MULTISPECIES: preprotein translocase subunit SecE [unclassified Janibacter]|uniref:preprotein translocase subunit SecE n=1 Tax=unclassified Janibacter TaxID=2649294 RepID=UPI003CFF6BF4